MEILNNQIYTDMHIDDENISDKTLTGYRFGLKTEHCVFSECDLL